MVALNRFFARFSWDVVGFSASTICAVHCLVVPLALMFSSVSGIEILHNHNLETFILMFSTAVGTISIIPGWYRHHRKAIPVLLFFTGLALIGLGRFNFPILTETLLTTGGAVIIACAHYMNWKLCRPHHAAQASAKGV
jgi:hypothetical protein